MVLVTRGTARLQTTDAARQYHTASVRNATDPAPSRDGHAVVLCWVPVEVQTPAPVALSTAYLRRRRGLRVHRGRCSRFHVRRFAEALTLGQKIVQPFREASKLSAPSEARSSLSALYGESGVAAVSFVEVVDDAVLSGRARTTKQARHRRDASGRGF